MGNFIVPDAARRLLTFNIYPLNACQETASALRPEGVDLRGHHIQVSVIASATAEVLGQDAESALADGCHYYVSRSDIRAALAQNGLDEAQVSACLLAIKIRQIRILMEHPEFTVEEAVETVRLLHWCYVEFSLRRPPETLADYMQILVDKLFVYLRTFNENLFVNHPENLEPIFRLLDLLAMPNHPSFQPIREELVPVVNRIYSVCQSISFVKIHSYWPIDPKYARFLVALDAHLGRTVPSGFESMKAICDDKLTGILNQSIQGCSYNEDEVWNNIVNHRQVFTFLYICEPNLTKWLPAYSIPPHFNLHRDEIAAKVSEWQACFATRQQLETLLKPGSKFCEEIDELFLLRYLLEYVPSSLQDLKKAVDVMVGDAEHIAAQGFVMRELRTRAVGIEALKKASGQNEMCPDIGDGLHSVVTIPNKNPKIVWKDYADTPRCLYEEKLIKQLAALRRGKYFLPIVETPQLMPPPRKRTHDGSLVEPSQLFGVKMSAGGRPGPLVAVKGGGFKEYVTGLDTLKSTKFVIRHVDKLLSGLDRESYLTAVLTSEFQLKDGHWANCGTSFAKGRNRLVIYDAEICMGESNDFNLVRQGNRDLLIAPLQSAFLATFMSRIPLPEKLLGRLYVSDKEKKRIVDWMKRKDAPIRKKFTNLQNQEIDILIHSTLYDVDTSLAPYHLKEPHSYGYDQHVRLMLSHLMNNKELWEKVCSFIPFSDEQKEKVLLQFVPRLTPGQISAYLERLDAYKKYFKEIEYLKNSRIPIDDRINAVFCASNLPLSMKEKEQFRKDLTRILRKHPNVAAQQKEDRLNAIIKNCSPSYLNITKAIYPIISDVLELNKLATSKRILSSDFPSIAHLGRPFYSIEDLCSKLKTKYEGDPDSIEYRMIQHVEGKINALSKGAF